MNTIDATSNISYEAWELNDEACFNFQVPAGYSAGNDFTLKLWESTDTASGASGLHNWGATVVLVQPDVNILGAVTETQAFSGQFMAPVTSGTVTVRSLTISAAGQISSTPMVAEDLVAVTLKRIEASSGEDPNPIQVSNMVVVVDVPTASNVCSGDVGWVIDSVRDQFEGADSGFLTNAFIIRQVNEATQRLAIAGAWSKDTWVNLYSGSGQYDLNVHISDFVEPLNCVFSGATAPLTPFGSNDEYWNYMISGDTPSGDPTQVLIQGSNMFLAPVPDADVVSGVRVYHTYLPDDISCSSVSLPVPKAFRNVYTEFVLFRAYERDSQADEYKAKKAQQHLGAFDKLTGDLVSAGQPMIMTTRPG